MFNKYEAKRLLAEAGDRVTPGYPVYDLAVDGMEGLRHFLKIHQIQRAIVKPISGGSSIGVREVKGSRNVLNEVVTRLEQLPSEALLVEPYRAGREFTLIVLENEKDQPVALVPIEIRCDGVFTYRKKYLATGEVSCLCPPSFADQVVNRIRGQGERVFHLFGMRDCARLDGWVLDDGRIEFSDFNPVSGMEQNSFLFLAASHVGLNHSELLAYLLALRLPPR